jgi:hypothetical protein
MALGLPSNPPKLKFRAKVPRTSRLSNSSENQSRRPELDAFRLSHAHFRPGRRSLFSNPNARSEATARFTFFAKTTLDSRFELGNLIKTSAPGELTLYLNENPHGDFNNPGSFAGGNAIVSYSTRLHNVLNVQAPNQGITNAVVDLEQLRNGSINLNGHRYQWGHNGLRARLSATGQATRTQVDPLRAFFLVGGQVVIVDP